MLEVGRVVKPHGLRGDVIVSLVTNRTERLDPGTVLDGGDRTLEVVRSSQHKGRWIVTFHGVNSIDEAEAIRDTVLRAEPLDDPDELWVHELMGARVVEADGTERGTVTGVQANPASDLLVLDTGALVPLRFVVEHGPGRVVVDVPEGLFDT
jgi:16S rRNA processing protein RimM